MGIVDAIGYDKFPRQSNDKGKRAQVCFNHNTDYLIPGIIVRDDTTEPYKCIIKLDDGRYILSTECQYTVD